VRTLYACLAENEGELSFEPNQIIINGESSTLPLPFYLTLSPSAVSRSNEPGWLVGTLNGKSGLIPENYVEILN
jgi:Rho GTPase-activating protein 26